MIEQQKNKVTNAEKRSYCEKRPAEVVSELLT
jgi:hypothetical protein